MSIEVRAARDSDLNSLWPLLEAMGKTDSRDATLQRAAQIIVQADHFLPVALIADRVVGYAWVQDYGAHLRGGERTAYLHDLFVVTDLRRTGIARQLMNAVIEWSRSRPIKSLQWQSSGQAMPFYESLGLVGDPCPDPDYPFFEITF